MNVKINYSLFLKILQWVLLVIIICFSLLRFVNINADFPSGITTSGVLYTDEGWYTNGAVRYILTGQWYLEGDSNVTAISMPVGQLLHFLTFGFLGVSVSSARFTIIVCFLLTILLEALFIRQRFGNFAAVLSALLLSTNFFAFAYSRLVLVYLMASFFIVASLYIAGGLKGKANLQRFIIASLLLAAGILTNTIAAGAIPLLVFLAWRSSSNYHDRIVYISSVILILMVFVGGYMVYMKNLYPVDFAFFKWASSGRLFETFHDWRWNFTHKLIPRMQVLGYGFFELSLFLTVLALGFSKRFRKDTLIHILIGYAVIYIGMLSINSYSPPRYYLMLLVPFTGLCATACSAIVDWLVEKKWSAIAAIPFSLVFLVSIYGSLQIVTYLSKPAYSFYNMTHQVEKTIKEREGTVRGVRLFGDISDSVSLEIGTNASNTLLYTSETVIPRMRKYHPEYLIVHTSSVDHLAEDEGGNITELGAWDVFGNYYANGEQVRLYAVQWPQEN
jgi:4-amino-4-deoxy-L-arabinose transferase-like glycosyltransferase